MKTIKGHNVKIFTDNIEAEAVEQIERLMAIDVFADKKIRIMPDVHAGAGCVIGFTGDLGDKVIPNIVGVDIGCGMRVIKLGSLKELGGINLHKFHEHINLHVPSGMMCRNPKKGHAPLVEEQDLKLYRQAKGLVNALRCHRQLRKQNMINESIGSLGGGNHFIELAQDPDGIVYLVIHTGSRNLGKQVADIYQARAIQHLTDGAEEFEDKIKAMIAECKYSDRRREIEATIRRMRAEQRDKKPSLPQALCYLEGEAREDYLHDMRLCQRWAVINRTLIGLLLLRFFGNKEFGEVFESIHNYISDDNMIRKGAISAHAGERCIIPLNMRDGSLLCTGLGNEDWNSSAPHGAGRIMSRREAARKLCLDDFRASMQGIYSECIGTTTIDEAPMVYKPAAEIIDNISETVRIDTVIRPIFNFKATEA